MHLFTDYIQPLTLWLYDHPNLALLITFFISFAESLAIIGSLIPGSVTMTAIGILAGAGVMRIDLTLSAAALGAVAGDGVSYLLGYIFSGRLTSIWPFSRYPSWLNYGKDYFARHGGKSVLIGRFVGPLRSIIPVIAGMMHMSHLRFYFANIISAILWSLLYVMPGVLIGTASSELSPEVATHLFLIILFILASTWLISLGLKWLFILANRLIRIKLDHFWRWAIHHRYLGKLAKKLTPPAETPYYPTAAFFLLFVLTTLFFCILALLVVYGLWISRANQSLHLFFQSLRTHSFDVFFIIASQIMSPLTLIVLLVSVSLIAIYYNDWRSLAYWLSLSLSTILALLLLHWLINSPEPQGLLGLAGNSSFPITRLTFATSLGLALFLHINAYSHTRFKRVLKIALLSCLLLVGLTPLYLGDNWLSDILGAYLAGFSLCLGYWLFYRRYRSPPHYNPYLPLALLTSLFLATTLASLFTYSSSMRSHQPYFAQYVCTDELWWNQTKPLLPIYRTNRIGRRIALFNLQYVGSLNHLEQALISYGWQKQNTSLLNTLMTRVTHLSSVPELPLMAQLYLNKKPVLIMIYVPPHGERVQILQIWRSNYHLQNFKQPIWLGSVQFHRTRVRGIKNDQKSIDYVSEALATSSFLQRSIPFPAQVAQQQLPIKVEPVLLLVRELRLREKPNHHQMAKVQHQGTFR